ncbi:hypothetical protein ACQ5SK_43625 [Bradyrhizobium japonicum]
MNGRPKKKDTEEFRVPSLAESSQEYNGLIVNSLGCMSDTSRSTLRATSCVAKLKARAAGGQPLSPSVAASLGDAPDSLTLLSQRQREVATEMNNIETAQEILRRRIEEARNGASKAVCDSVRGEYQRRLGAVCEAARALEAAREDHDSPLDDIEREDVRVDHFATSPSVLSRRPARRKGFPLFEGSRGGGTQCLRKLTSVAAKEAENFYPGTYFKTDDTDPIAIARALRKESKLGKREARLEQAEAKVGRR